MRQTMPQFLPPPPIFHLPLDAYIFHYFEESRLNIFILILTFELAGEVVFGEENHGGASMGASKGEACFLQILD